MGIDRIGKGGAPPSPDTAADSVGKKSEATRPFEVERKSKPEGAAAVGATSATNAMEPSALDRLRAGELDLNGYVDVKVDEATKGLEGLTPVELEDIRSMLRDQLRSDPGLADLVKTATGQMPTPPEE